MNNNREIVQLQKKQNKLKKEILKLKKTKSIYLLGIVFVLFLIVFFIEDKVYTFFNGIFNFIMASVVFGFILCIVFLKYHKNKIKEKEKSSKAIGANLYRLMKLEND